MNERIFISYKRADKERVFALKDSIEQATGEKCWIDLDGIESDAQFVDVIMNSIDNCEVFLFMRSKEHNKIANHRTDWTIREVNYALGEKKRIVFVALDNSPLPRWFKFMFPNQQEIDATDGAKLKGLHADLRSWLGIQPKMDNVSRAHLKQEETKLIAQDKAKNIKSNIKNGSKNIADTIIRYRTGASKGNSDAQYHLGYCYHYGEGIKQNMSEAVKWYRCAADQGHPAAQYELGYCYSLGHGIPKSYAEAFYWYFKSANSGYAKAQFEVGTCYYDGNGVTKNVDEALKWYVKAAEQGYEPAKNRIESLKTQFGNKRISKQQDFTKKSNVNMHNGHEFVDLGLSVKWATCNIGASKSDDYGDYFAWGETQTKSIYDWRGYKWCKNHYTNIIKYNCSYGMLDHRKQLEISDDAANVILGGKWRIPTYEEFLELKEKCTWRWITQNGVNGYKIIGPNKNSIFLPAAGYRSEQLLYSLGYNGDYWLSLLDTAFSGGAWGARIASKEVRITSLDRYYGRSIRPVFS